MDFTVQNYKDTRSGFGEGLLEAGRRNPKVVAFCADLIGSLKMGDFAKEFPQRFFQTGIAEANMINMAAGMALSGFVPFTGTFAAFSTGRVFDQIRQSVAYSNKNVKIAASHAGITLGEDGATHQILEDIGMMKMLPNMTVISPCDATQTRIAVQKAIAHPCGPVYIRFGREAVPDFTDENQDFTIGKGQMMKQGSDITIVATGHEVWHSLVAADTLEQQGISVRVINIHTIKPLDRDILLKAAKETRMIFTVEEHQVAGGLGGAVAESLSEIHPTRIVRIGINDRFGESGQADELMHNFGLDTDGIVNKIRSTLQDD